MNRYKKDKHWYLGFLGFIGIYKLPEVLLIFQENTSIWQLTNLLYFFWFLYFIPTKQQ